jgi:endo-1,4-beta-xylanase
VPDPRVTNPELFDLRNPDAPIPQFVNAMKMAGIEITAEQVVEGITFEQIKAKDTNLLVVAGYDLNPDPNQSGEALEGRMPLLIAKQEGRTWAWKEAFLKELAEPLDFFIGTGIGGYGFAQYYEQMVKIQTRGDFNLGLQGMGQRWNDRVTPPYPAPIFYKHLDSDVLIQQRAGMTGFGHLLLWGAAAPAWLRTGHYTREEVISIMQDSLKSDIDRYKGKILFWNVVNEVGNNDFFLQVIGPEYVELAFRIAREADPSGILIYNDYSNHTIKSERTLHTKRIVDGLRAKGLIDMVGLETILFYPDLPTKQELVEGMRFYGIPVMVTEFNVNMGRFNGAKSEKLKLQAKAYYDAVSACLESGVCKGFIMIYVSDAANFWNTQQDLPGWSPQNDPSPFDQNFRPKPCYYAARMAVLDYMRSVSK